MNMPSPFLKTEAEMAEKVYRRKRCAVSKANKKMVLAVAVDGFDPQLPLQCRRSVSRRQDDPDQGNQRLSDSLKEIKQLRKRKRREERSKVAAASPAVPRNCSARKLSAKLFLGSLLFAEVNEDGTEKRANGAEKRVNSVEKTVNSTEKGAHSAQKRVKSARKRVDSAEKGVNTTEKGACSAENGVDSTEKRIKSSEKRVKTVEKRADSAEKGAYSAENGVDSAAKRVHSSEKRVQSAEKGVDTAAKRASSAAKRANSAENGVDSAERVNSAEKRSSSVGKKSNSAKKRVKSADKRGNSFQPAHPGPAERARFKNVLNQTGGLDEFLECRNFIISLWERDRKQNISLAECGVPLSSLKNDTPRTRLLRQVFNFLNDNGTINSSSSCTQKHKSKLVGYPKGVKTMNSSPKVEELEAPERRGGSRKKEIEPTNETSELEELNCDQMDANFVQDTINTSSSSTQKYKPKPVGGPKGLKISKSSPIAIEYETLKRRGNGRKLEEESTNETSELEELICGNTDVGLCIAHQVTAKSVVKKLSRNSKVEKIESEIDSVSTSKKNSYEYDEISIREDTNKLECSKTQVVEEPKCANDDVLLLETSRVNSPVLGNFVKKFTRRSKAKKRESETQFQLVPAKKSNPSSEASVEWRSERKDGECVVKFSSLSNECDLNLSTSRSSVQIDCSKQITTSRQQDRPGLRAFVIDARLASSITLRNLQYINLGVELQEERCQISERFHTHRLLLSCPLDLSTGIIARLEGDADFGLIHKNMNLKLLIRGSVIGTKILAKAGFDAKEEPALTDQDLATRLARRAVVKDDCPFRYGFGLKIGVELSLKKLARNQHLLNPYPDAKAALVSCSMSQNELQIQKEGIAIVPNGLYCPTKLAQRERDMGLSNMENGFASEPNEVCQLVGQRLSDSADWFGLCVDILREANCANYDWKSQMGQSKFVLHAGNGELVALSCRPSLRSKIVQIRSHFSKQEFQRYRFGTLSNVVIESPVAFCVKILADSMELKGGASSSDQSNMVAFDFQRSIMVPQGIAMHTFRKNNRLFRIAGSSSEVSNVIMKQQTEYLHHFDDKIKSIRALMSGVQHAIGTVIVLDHKKHSDHDGKSPGRVCRLSNKRLAINNSDAVKLNDRREGEVALDVSKPLSKEAGSFSDDTHGELRDSADGTLEKEVSESATEAFVKQHWNREVKLFTSVSSLDVLVESEKPCRRISGSMNLSPSGEEENMTETTKLSVMEESEQESDGLKSADKQNEAKDLTSKLKFLSTSSNEHVNIWQEERAITESADTHEESKSFFQSLKCQQLAEDTLGVLDSAGRQDPFTKKVHLQKKLKGSGREVMGTPLKFLSTSSNEHVNIWQEERAITESTDRHEESKSFFQSLECQQHAEDTLGVLDSAGRQDSFTKKAHLQKKLKGSGREVMGSQSLSDVPKQKKVTGSYCKQAGVNVGSASRSKEAIVQDSSTLSCKDGMSGESINVCQVADKIVSKEKIETPYALVAKPHSASQVKSKQTLVRDGEFSAVCSSSTFKGQLQHCLKPVESVHSTLGSTMYNKVNRSSSFSASLDSKSQGTIGIDPFQSQTKYADHAFAQWKPTIDCENEIKCIVLEDKLATQLPDIRATGAVNHTAVCGSTMREHAKDDLFCDVPKEQKQLKMVPVHAVERQSTDDRIEVREILRKLATLNSTSTKPTKKVELLQEAFEGAKTIAGRHLMAHQMLQLPRTTVKEILGSNQGLTVLNSWILESVDKNGTQLLRLCMQLLLIVADDLSSVRQTGIGRTVKDKVVGHFCHDIQVLANQLGKIWVESNRKDKTIHSAAKHIILPNDSLEHKKLGRLPKPMIDKEKTPKFGLQPSTGKDKSENCGVITESSAVRDTVDGSNPPSQSKIKDEPTTSCQDLKNPYAVFSCEELNLLQSPSRNGYHEVLETIPTDSNQHHGSEEAHALLEISGTGQKDLPRILSFRKFSRQELSVGCGTKRKAMEIENADLLDFRDKRPFPAGDEDRKQKVRNWAIDFSLTSLVGCLAASLNSDGVEIHLDGLFDHPSSRLEQLRGDLYNPFSLNAKKQCTKLHRAVEDSPRLDMVNKSVVREEYTPSFSMSGNEHSVGGYQNVNESFSGTSPHSLRNTNMLQVQGVSIGSRASSPGSSEVRKDNSKGLEIKNAVSEYVAQLLTPLFKTRKLQKDGVKYIHKKTVSKVMERSTELDIALSVFDFLDTKRKIKIRSLVDKLVERFLEDQYH